MTQYRKHLGKWGETEAARFVQERGLEILASNVYTPYGELDLVAKDGNQLIFIEVKTRANSTYGLPEQAITKKKQLHLIQSAEYYLQNLDTPFDGWRIDVVAIRKLADGQPLEITWFENAVT